MKILIAVFAALGTALPLVASDRLNVLFIMSDDLNYALSGLGHPECKTPNLDAFAKTAVSFSRAYCQFPLCGPSRASIMSGQYPAKTGVGGNSSEVDPDRVTLPRHFQNHGYWSGRVSKIYHMGIPQDIIEGTDGGDHALSWVQRFNIPALESMTSGKIVDYLNPDDPDIFPEERKRWSEAMAKGEPYEMVPQARSQFAVLEVADEHTGQLVDTMAADKAIEILEDRSDEKEPFFLAVGFVRPHFPFIATEKALAVYEADNIRFPAFPENDYDDIPAQAINARMEFPDQSIRELRRGYFGAITYMDEQFGRLMEEVDRLQLREETIIVFVSDHGYLIGEHEMHKKSKLWEEAIHVPLLISAPGLEGGRQCDAFVELIDLYPTLTDLAGLPRDPGCQGLSLVGLLEEPSSQRTEKPDALIQVSKGYGLRNEQWAFMHYPAWKKAPEASMLFDMKKDPNQFTNLAGDAEYREVVERLKKRLEERIRIAGGD